MLLRDQMEPLARRFAHTLVNYRPAAGKRLAGLQLR